MHVLFSFEYNMLRKCGFQTQYQGFLMLSKMLSILNEPFVFLSQRYAA